MDGSCRAPAVMAGVSGSSRRGSATHLVLVEGLGELVDARGHLEALVQDLLGAGWGCVWDW